MLIIHREVSYRRKILEPAGIVPADEKSTAIVKKSVGKTIKKPTKKDRVLQSTLRAATDAFKRSNSVTVYRKNMDHRSKWEDEKLDMFFGRVVSPQPFRPLDMPGDAQSLHLALGEIEKYYDNFFSAEKYTPENIQKDFENMQVTKQPRTPVGLDPLICLINDYNNAVMFAQQQKYADARLAVESISERTKHALRNQGPHLLIYLLVMICDSDCPAEFIFNNYLNRYLVDLCKIVVGPNHPITLILWQILMAESKTQMGEVLVRKSLEIFKNVFGQSHGETLLLMISVTNILWQQQLYVEAETFLHQTLERSVPVFGGSDFYSCHARYSLVYCRALLRNWEGVKETVDDIFAYNAQGTVYELGLVLLEAVADMFRENEDYAYAEYLLTKTFVESTITRGVEHQFTKNIQANIDNIQKLRSEKEGSSS